MSLDLTAADKALKVIYEKQDPIDVLLKESPFFAMVTKTKRGGKTVEMSIRTATTQRAGAVASTAYSQTSDSKFDGWELGPFRRTIAYESVEGDALAASRSSGDTGAFVDLAKNGIDSCNKTVAMDLAYACFSDGTGARGKIDASSTLASDTIVLTKKSDARFFFPGMTVTVSATAGGAPKSGSVVLLEVDEEAGTLKTDGGNWSTQIGTIAAGDFLHRASTHNVVMPGVAAFLPATAPSTSLYGVNRAVDKIGLGGHRVPYTGIQISEQLVRAASAAGRRGGRPRHAFADPDSYDALLLELGTKKDYTETEIKPGIGFRGVRVISGAADIEVYSDPWCHAGQGGATGGVIYVLQMEDLELFYSSQKLPQTTFDDGRMLAQELGNDRVLLSAKAYTVFGIAAPGHCVRITTNAG